MKLARLIQYPLLRMIALGSAIFIVQSISTRDVVSTRQLHVDAATVAVWKARWEKRRANGASSLSWEDALAAEVDEELLIEEALRRNLHVSDLVVCRRLRQNLIFAELDLVGTDGLSLAYALDMPQNDPLVRRRLRLLMEMQLRHVAEPAPLDAAQLDDIQRAGRTSAESLSFYHVLQSGDAADVWVQEVVDAYPDPVEAIQHSAAFLHGLIVEGASPARVEKLLGPQFAAQLAGQPMNQWFGPIRSAYGQHMVWLTHRSSHWIEPNRDRARYELLANAERQALQRGLSSLRAKYTVILDSPA